MSARLSRWLCSVSVIVGSLLVVRPSRLCLCICIVFAVPFCTVRASVIVNRVTFPYVACLGLEVIPYIVLNVLRVRNGSFRLSRRLVRVIIVLVSALTLLGKGLMLRYLAGNGSFNLLCGWVPWGCLDELWLCTSFFSDVETGLFDADCSP